MLHRPAVAQGSLGEVERRIKASVYTPLAALAASAWVTPEPVPYECRREGRELLLTAGQRWSEAVFDCAWFRFTGTVPDGAAGHEIVLLIDVSGEGCVLDSEGRPLLGLTNVNSTFSRQHGEPGKRVVPFRAPAAGAETVEIWVEAGANDLFGARQDNGVLKAAEDGNGLIVRLYEAAGASTRALLHFGFALAAAEAIDLIEENPVRVEIAGRELRLDLRSFDILTLRLLPAAR